MIQKTGLQRCSNISFLILIIVYLTVHSSGCDWANKDDYSDYDDYFDNTWFCCTDSKPCGVNEGHCDSNDECYGDLLCGTENCSPSFPYYIDCCYDSTGI